MVVSSDLGSASALVEVIVDMSEIDVSAGWHVVIWVVRGRRRCCRVIQMVDVVAGDFL